MLNLRPTSAEPIEDPLAALIAAWERMTEDARRELVATAKALEEVRGRRATAGTVEF